MAETSVGHPRRRSIKPGRKQLIIFALLFAAGAIPLGTALYSSAVRGLNPLTAWSCTSEKRGGLDNVSGWDLEIEHTSCDLFAKDEAISVYATWHGSARGLGWFRKRMLIFRYAPFSPDELLPGFESSGPHKILISVPEVSSISVQQYAIGDTAVNYHIGRIEYPDRTGLEQAH
jgi:hypothetical protein